MGAPFDGNTDNDDITAPGAAYVFTRSDGVWSQQGAKLTATDPHAPTFGGTVSLSADGNTALIGRFPEDPTGSQVGGAWVFARSGGSWSQQGSQLAADDETGNGNFGSGVALSACGDTALIGGDDDDDTNFEGAAWVFQSHPPCTYPSAVSSTQSALAYWRLGETSGTTAVDQLGGHDGTYSGGYTLGVPGALHGDSDTAVSLDGSSGQVLLPSLGSASDWTVEGWTDLNAGAAQNPSGNKRCTLTAAGCDC